MATSFVFGNKSIKIPGSYSRILSGVKNTPAGLEYGALLVVDTGSMATWGGGSGIDGEFVQGKDSVYTFDNIQDARNFVKGGVWYELLANLFKPSELGIAGISTVTFVRAATTTAATITNTFTGGGANGGTIVLDLKEEGLVANGALTSLELTKGYATILVASGTGYRLRLYQGSFKGLDFNGDPITGISQANSKPILIAETPTFTNLNQLANLKNDRVWSSVADVTVTPAGTGAVDAADLVSNSSYTLATGGTETYGTTQLESALEAIKDEIVDFILLDRWGADADDAENLAIVANAVDNMTLKPDIYVGGYSEKADYLDSIDFAILYDSDIVTVVHGGIKIPTSSGGFKNSPSIYLASYVLGREAGLPPQVPLSFKGVSIQGLTHQLSDLEVEASLDRGVLVVKKVNNSFDIVKGINSLQNNANLLNEDGTSPSKQVKRIIRQINKELAILSREQLLKTPLGVNRNTLSEQDLKGWVETYLLSITATPLQDNLILSFEDVVVTREQDAYFVNYGIILNTEINFLFMTGTVISI